MDAYVEIGDTIIEGDGETTIVDLYAHLYIDEKSSSSEDEKSRDSSEDETLISSPEDEKTRSSSEDEKVMISSEDEKSRSSSEDEKVVISSENRFSSDEYEGVKRQHSDDEEGGKEKKRKVVYDLLIPQWISRDGVHHYPVFDEDKYDTYTYAGKYSEEVGDEDENRDDDRSNFTEEVVESTPVSKEEYTAEFTPEERRFYFENDDGGELRLHRATKAEMEAIHRAMYESQCFDLPFLPGVHYGICRTDLSTPEDAIPVAQCAKCALDFYNKKNNDEYVFERLVMSSTRPCDGAVYFITFKATQRFTGSTKTFETRAHLKWEDGLHVMMCRMKKEDDRSTSA